MDPSKTPALRPPPGVEPNFTNPPSLQPERIAVSSICLAICIIFVIARTYTRVRLNTFNLDDCVYLFALASFIAYIGLLIYVGEIADGRHQWDVTIANASKCLKFENITIIMYCVTLFPLKYVVLRQIELIFFDHRRNTFTYKAIWTLIWLTFLFTLSFGISFIFACVPRKKIWEPDIEGHCINTKSTTVGGCAVNMVIDYLILIIPLAAVSRLQLSTARKLRAAAVFTVGILACASSTVRLYYTVKLFQTEDRTWAFAPVGQWTVAEFTTLFLVACFPYVPRLYQLLSKRDKQIQTDSSRTRTTNPTQNASSGVQTVTGWSELEENRGNNEGIMLDQLSNSEGSASTDLVIMSNV
ncbi:uncharacterized protein F4807DRAFT_158795 [Annulohypoxylon truncatum]|uniref:uncharacterized protein n=1 Tax=Annulohypoxylon truncatum TaxID=327061 RepID=UPI002007434B|nr:uncharacterized protein F4807DRAFT_158795 [Annulohypoxylon truncatum]KAI1208290.1 hypothetical protein F4807DRAFT_158795 [Annulohypoxylon truncatum]